MKTAQDYMRDTASGEARGGFNSRIQGFTHLQSVDGIPSGSRWGQRTGGWELADEMIKKGKIYFRHNFHQSHQNCNGFAFPYGGTWACNTCNTDGFQKPWWIIKVLEDGDEWCCIGEDFVNLQESNCYAFGKSRQEAIKNYGDLYSENGRDEMKIDEDYSVIVRPFDDNENFINVDVLKGQFDFIGLRDSYTLDEFKVIMESMQAAIDVYEARP